MKPSPIVLSLALFTPVACDEASDDTTQATAAESETDGTDGPGMGGEMSVDPAQIANLALDYAAYQKVNDAPLPSVHGLADTANIWVPTAGIEAYTALSGFEPGALLVKEQLDAQGQFANVTAMFKGPEGYAPEAGDWWFGLVDPDGAVVVGGQPAPCLDCHNGAAQTDYVFGLQ